MATNQTTNYHLNQWEPTDQVLRTDFNADNAKLDTALAGLAAKGTELEADLAAAAAGPVNQEFQNIRSPAEDYILSAPGRYPCGCRCDAHG